MAHVEVARRNLSFDQWVKCNFEKYEELVVKEIAPTGSWKVREGEYLPDGYRWHNEFRDIEKGDRWGGPDATALFEGIVSVPEDLAGKDVYFQMLTATEVIISSEGKLLEGLDPNRMRFLLFPNAVAGQSMPIQMEAYVRSKPDDERNPRAAALRGCVQRFNKPSLVVVDQEAQDLAWDLQVLFMTAFGPVINEDVKVFLQNKIKTLLTLMPAFEVGGSVRRDTIPAIKSYIEKEIYNGYSPFAKEGQLACVSHSHLDVAYFWRVKQTIQKNARTVLIQLNLMDRYPEFSYAHSQAWTYEVLEKYYPDLYERVKQKIKEGQWEVVGAMYVEPDCNVVSGESLLRQVLYGKLYFSEKFGVDVKNCWLPDVFGNSAILPQILQKTGVPYFVSNKMSTWNDTNRFPHNHFIWRGVDGTDVYACVPPVHFITWMDPNQAVEHWDALQDKEVVTESLQMYGYGDGGSGATDEMLEHFHRQQKLPGVPNQRLTSAEEFLSTNFDGKDDLPLWQGDLYLEMHRGTFTNKGVLKKLNRRGENCLKETEALCALASLHGMVYPVKELQECWKLLLVNQFHDILPGTHVGPVTKDALDDYSELFSKLDVLNKKAVEKVTIDKTYSFTVVNRDGRVRSGLGYISGDRIPENSVTQKTIDAAGKSRTALYYGELKPFEIRSLDNNNRIMKKDGLKVSDYRMESPYFIVEFNKNGDISNIFDKKHNRNINAHGEVINNWQLFEDTPGKYNAWDIMDRFEDRPLDCGNWTDPEIVENGPLTVAIRWKRSFSDSSAVQIVRLFAEENRVEFDIHVDWHEREKLLKTAFPLSIHASTYSCDNSAGVTTYENHRNTSWQEARYEVPCHKWVDFSEGLYGVSLLNDSKYGVDVSENTVRLSLLRASIRPDSYSDQGEHSFKYAITTHGGQWQSSQVMHHAQEINEPITILSDKSPVVNDSINTFSIAPAESLQGQSLKLAEDSSGDIIIRLLEYSGTSCLASLKVPFLMKSAHIADGLENPLEEIYSDDNVLSFPVKAFEIVTLRIQRK